MDTKVKIWDVYNNQKCVRTYMGHTQGVRDICFTNDGRKFLSASYDRNICLWDTETGQCLSVFCNGKIPYCIKFHPERDKQHYFLAGYSDKKIVQWDTNSGKIVQKYDQHLGAINTITFIDGNRRFVSTSDDKSIRIWEWGIPVVIKYISEPSMHSMPSATLYPDGTWFAVQSLDNQVLVYSTRDRFRLNKKKKFTGHLCAGYACQVNFSPDGHFIMSGDADGKVWFWDFHTGRTLKTIKAHEKVCIGCEWHPIEPSRIATCGWDGVIHYWD
jgi:pre-mRNA-processing factor 17